MSILEIEMSEASCYKVNKLLVEKVALPDLSRKGHGQIFQSTVQF